MYNLLKWTVESLCFYEEYGFDNNIIIVFTNKIVVMKICLFVSSLRGAFSEVYKAVNKKNGEFFAIKVVDKKSLKGKEESLQNEIDVMKK